MTPILQRMLDDMRLRNLAANTQDSYLQRVSMFSRHFNRSPELIGPDENLMHNLRAERFYETRMINGRLASADGPIKTFPLRGIKDSPTYLHDGRLLTLEDTVEFFNLILGVRLNAQEKADLVAFLRTL